MVNDFQWLDSWLIARATRFAHRFQQWTGLTSFFLAKCGVVYWGLEQMIDCFNYFHPLPWLIPPDKGRLFFSLGIIVIVFFHTTILTEADRRFYSGKLTMNPGLKFLRAQWWPVRILLVGLSIVCVITYFVAPFRGIICMIQSTGTCGLMAFEYFAQVNPMPPGTSKIREWLSIITMRPVEQE